MTQVKSNAITVRNYINMPKNIQNQKLVLVLTTSLLVTKTSKKDNVSLE